MLLGLLHIALSSTASGASYPKTFRSIKDVSSRSKSRYPTTACCRHLTKQLWSVATYSQVSVSRMLSSKPSAPALLAKAAATTSHLALVVEAIAATSKVLATMKLWLAAGKFTSMFPSQSGGLYKRSDE